MKLKPLSALLSAALLFAPAAQSETYKWDTVAMGGGGYATGVIPSKTERGVVYMRTDVGGAYRWDMHNERWIALQDWLSEERSGLMGVEAIAIDPKNAGTVYLMSGTDYLNNGKSAILRSRDYGRTFEIFDTTAQFKVHGNGMGRGNGERLQVDPGDSNILYAGTRRNGLFKSLDAGATWNRMESLPVTSTPNDNGIGFVLPDPASVDGGPAQRIFVGVSRMDSAGPNLYFSYDGGETFEPVEGGPTGLMPQRAVISPEGKLYITYADGAGPHNSALEAMSRGQVWEYDAAAGNWTNITPAGVSGPFGGISMDPANPLHLVMSTTNYWRPQTATGGWGEQIFTSRDGGRSWTNLMANPVTINPKGADWITASSIHWASDVQFDPFDTRTAWVVSGNGVFRSTNIEAPSTTWNFEAGGYEETGTYSAVSLPNGQLATSIGDYDGFLHSDVAQYAPRHTPSMGSTTSLVASATGQFMARVGNKLYYSTSTGASWTEAATVNGTAGRLGMSADGQVLLHAPEKSTTTYRSTNFGGSWSTVTGLDFADARPYGDKVNPQKFYAYNSSTGRMLVSTDGGASFAPKGTVGLGGSRYITPTYGAEGDVWVCQPNGLMHTTDSGETFSKVATVRNCTAVAVGKAAPGANYGTLYILGTVGVTRGVLRSTDMGATWVRVNDDAHQYGGLGNDAVLAADLTRYGVVYRSTMGRGVAYGKVAGDGDVVVTPVDSTAAPVEPPNKCEYVVTNSWWGGGIAEIHITNNRSTAISGWTVNWTYSDSSAPTQWWNGNITGSSPTFTASGVDWNQTISPGGTVSFGMVFNSGGPVPTEPTIPVFSGDVCK